METIIMLVTGARRIGKAVRARFGLPRGVTRTRVPPPTSRSKIAAREHP
jgi:hypothetical protein